MTITTRVIAPPLMAPLLLACLAGGPTDVPSAANFDGRRFHNVPEVAMPDFGDLLRWQRTAKPGVWPDWVEAPPGPPPPSRIACPDLRVTFVNHATVLIQTAGLNILTDPIYVKRPTPIRGVGPRRRRPPGIRFDDLPPIDVVVVSHNHYDHLDIATLRKLAAEHSPRILIGLGNGRLLRRKRVDGGVEMDWWQRVDVGAGVTIWGVPAQHWSLRGLADRDRTLWLGYVIDTVCGRTYFAGDTGFGPHFARIAERFGPVRLALLPIGAYRPRWFMRASHIDPAEAVRAHRILRATTSVAIHYGTFPLGDDGRWEPVEDLARALGTRSHPAFWVLREGVGAAVPAQSAGGGRRTTIASKRR